MKVGKVMKISMSHKSYRERIRLQEERARKILKLQEDIGQMTCKERIFFDEMGSHKKF